MNKHIDPETKDFVHLIDKIEECREEIPACESNPFIKELVHKLQSHLAEKVIEEAKAVIEAYEKILQEFSYVTVY